MAKINLMFISENAYSLFNPKSRIIHGGAEVQLFHLAKVLSNYKEFNVGFVVRDTCKNRTESYGRIKIFKWKTTHPFLAKLKLFVLRDIINLISFARLHKADILITRAPGTTPFKVLITAKILRKKFIYMVAHDKDCEKRHPILRRKISKYLFYIARKYADLIIAQSYEQKRRLNDLGLEKIKVIRSGHPPSTAFQKKKENYILWVARAEKWKRPEVLLEIARRLKKYHFVMVCPGFDQYPDYPNSFVDEIKNTPNIRFIDRVPYNEIDEMFRKARLFVNTSSSEGFPNTFIQAWKNETPVVSLSIDPDSVIAKNRLGFCAETVDSMIDNIELLMKNEHLYSKIAKGSYKYYLKNFNIDEAVRLNSEVYKEIICAV